MCNPIEIGSRIKTRREELNLTLKDVADRIGVASSTILRYENGTIQRIKLPVIEAIAKALDVSPTWLYGKPLPGAESSENPALTKRDQKDIGTILDQTRQLLAQEGLMFDGKPASQEDVQSILDAMQIGLEMAKKRNKEKYTPKKYRE